MVQQLHLPLRTPCSQTARCTAVAVLQTMHMQRRRPDPPSLPPTIAATCTDLASCHAASSCSTCSIRTTRQRCAAFEGKSGTYFIEKSKLSGTVQQPPVRDPWLIASWCLRVVYCVITDMPPRRQPGPTLLPACRTASRLQGATGARNVRRRLEAAGTSDASQPTPQATVFPFDLSQAMSTARLPGTTRCPNCLQGPTSSADGGGAQGGDNAVRSS